MGAGARAGAGVSLRAAGRTREGDGEKEPDGRVDAERPRRRTLTFASPSSMPVALRSACHSLYAFVASRRARSSGTWHVSFCPSWRRSVAILILIFCAFVRVAAPAVAAAASAAPSASADSTTDASAAPGNTARSFARHARADSTCFRSGSAEGTETPSVTYSPYNTAVGAGRRRRRRRWMGGRRSVRISAAGATHSPSRRGSRARNTRAAREQPTFQLRERRTLATRGGDLFDASFRPRARAGADALDDGDERRTEGLRRLPVAFLVGRRGRREGHAGDVPTCRVQSSKMLGGASQTVSKIRVKCNGK